MVVLRVPRKVEKLVECSVGLRAEKLVNKSVYSMVAMMVHSKAEWMAVESVVMMAV